MMTNLRLLNSKPSHSFLFDMSKNDPNFPVSVRPASSSSAQMLDISLFSVIQKTKSQIHCTSIFQTRKWCIPILCYEAKECLNGMLGNHPEETSMMNTAKNPLLWLSNKCSEVLFSSIIRATSIEYIFCPINHVLDESSRSLFGWL